MPQFLFISKTFRLLQARLLPMTSILFGSEIPEPMTSLAWIIHEGIAIDALEGARSPEMLWAA